MALLLIFAGLVLLVVGGDALVRGAVNLSKRMGIPALIISLTIVAFGTSAPELLIAIQAALEGFPQLALGNIIGSNIANILLVLGVPALVFSISSHGTDTQIEFYLMILSTFTFIAFCFILPFGPMLGAILLLMMSGILVFTFRRAQKSTELAEALTEEVSEVEDATWKSILFLIGGLVALPLGAKFLVDGSIEIAERFGVSEAVIGLTIVAVGTSLPELATTVMAAYRRQADVAIGNVLGSNMFNLMVIGGVAALFGPIDVDPQFLRLDLWVMLGVSLLVIPYVFKHVSLNRIWGALFCIGYGLYLWVIL
ncbi:MAG: calcium/sodium antiporter [Pseudomonadota bacterium]